MNILGEKDQLAMEWNSCVIDKRWFPTQLVFWIGGQPLGKMEEDNLQLFYFDNRLEDFLLYENVRHIPFLYGRNKEEIFLHVDQRAHCYLIEYDEEKGRDKIECYDPEPYDRYFLEEQYCEWLKYVFTFGDMFFPELQDYSIMIINEPPNRIQRVIWLDTHGPRYTLHEHNLPIGYFEKVAWEFLKQVRDFMRESGYHLDEHLEFSRKQGYYGKFRKHPTASLE